MKWLQNECKILDVVLVKVAESDKLADLAQIGRRWHVSEQLKFFAAEPYAFRSENKSKVGHFCVAKETLGQVDLELMLLEFGKNLVEHSQMMFVDGCMDDDVIDVHDDVADTVEDFPMIHWNEAGQPNSPIGEVTHSNWPWPCTVKAVR